MYAGRSVIKTNNKSFSLLAIYVSLDYVYEFDLYIYMCISEGLFIYVNSVLSNILILRDFFRLHLHKVYYSFKIQRPKEYHSVMSGHYSYIRTYYITFIHTVWLVINKKFPQTRTIRFKTVLQINNSEISRNMSCQYIIDYRKY